MCAYNQKEVICQVISNLGLLVIYDCWKTHQNIGLVGKKIQIIQQLKQWITKQIEYYIWLIACFYKAMVSSMCRMMMGNGCKLLAHDSVEIVKSMPM